MKNYIFRGLLFCALTLTFFSCGGGEEKVMTPLAVSSKFIKTNVLGETTTITLDAPTSWYAATTGDKWIKLTPSSGEAGQTQVQVKISPNNGKASRSAQITFTSGQEKASVKVEQEWSYYFKLPCTQYTVGYGGGEVIIDGLPSAGFSIAMSPSAQQWVKATANVLNVAYNNGKASRNAVLKITDNTTKKEYEVLLIQA